ncbi:MAG TPA: IS4/IS5 family transposase [Nitrospirales bacterium]|nr:IS4/IS5 family transposase [Nitrospirales bacterium]
MPLHWVMAHNAYTFRRKLHVRVDEQTKEILAAEVTVSNVHDNRMFSPLLSQVLGKVCQVSGDGAYDTMTCYESIAHRRGEKASIPPRRNAKSFRRRDGSGGLTLRDANIQEIRQKGWYAGRIAGGCTRQSVAENAVSRFKVLFDPTLRARRFDNQKAEGLMKCAILNRMRSLGMPVSERIL